MFLPCREGIILCRQLFQLAAAELHKIPGDHIQFRTPAGLEDDTAFPKHHIVLSVAVHYIELGSRHQDIEMIRVDDKPALQGRFAYMEKSLSVEPDFPILAILLTDGPGEFAIGIDHHFGTIGQLLLPDLSIGRAQRRPGGQKGAADKPSRHDQQQ